MPTRRTYTIEEKLFAVAKAKKEGVAAVSKELNINECLIRRWSKKTQFPTNRLREEGGGRKPILAESTEREIVNWVHEQKKLKTSVTTSKILDRMLFYKPHSADPKLKKWPQKHNVYNFMKRWNLTLRDDLTSSSDESQEEDQKLPEMQTSIIVIATQPSQEPPNKARIDFLLNPL
jgi:transposase-like protein